MSGIFARGAFAAISAVAAYGVGCIMWILGRYFGVFPGSTTPYDFGSALLPPLVFPVVYLAWLTSRRWRKAVQSPRRLIHFGMAAALSVIASVAQFVWASRQSAGSSNSLPAVVAIILMLAVAVVAITVDRDVELALRFALFTLLAVVPVVVAGRVLAVAVAVAGYAVARVAHGGGS
jgi:hypothetical protein